MSQPESSKTANSKNKKVKITNPQWHKDNKNCDLVLNPDKLTSDQILMEWFTQYKNFEEYRGKSTKRITVLGKIVKHFESRGVNYRNAKSIGNKLDHMLKQYRTAATFRDCTGQGLLIPALPGKEAKEDGNSVESHEQLTGN